MKLVIPKGSTSRIITVFIQDSSSTTGAGLGSLTNASSIVGGFVREGSTGVALAVDEDVTTEGTYQAPSAQGKVRIGTPANMRTGTYELHFHNNLWASGAETVTITLGGATNMADLTLEVQLSDPVRGLGSPTALPNAAADAAGGLPISDAGGLDLDAQIGTKINDILTDTGTTLDGKIDAILADTNELQTDWTNGGRLDLIIDAVATASELAKVPKSDSNVTWNATALASIQSEANDALVANHLDHIYATSGTVVDAGAAADDFDTSLTDANQFWDDAILTFTSGALAGQSRTILQSFLASGRLTFDEAFTSAPANGVSFVIRATHTHTKSQITSDVWSNATRTLTAGTNIQLPANGLANITTWSVAITGNITGNLSGSVGSVTGLTASDVAAIKAKTDSMGFTVAGMINCNVRYVNGVQVDGAGSTADPWGPV